MYIVQEQGQITPRVKNFVVTKCWLLWSYIVSFSNWSLTHFEKLNFQYLPHTNAQGHTFDLAMKRSNVNLGLSFEQTWQTFFYQCYITRFSLEAFLVLEKKIFMCFIPYIGMAAILFNDSELFEQTDNTPSREGPMWNLMKIGPSSFRVDV